MIVRGATFYDIAGMVSLGRRMHEKSALADLPFDEDSAKLLGAQCMSLSTHCAFVAEDCGEIVGILLGLVRPFPYLNACYATDVLFCAERGGKELMRRFIEWAHERNVDRVVASVTFGGRDPDALYRRLGFQKVGGVYHLEMIE